MAGGARPGAVRIGRQEILDLGRSGRPWEFLPLALRALRLAPRDAEMRLLAAATAAELGLRTVARELLDALEPELAGEPIVADLARAVDALPGDALPAQTRAAWVEGVVAALAARGVDLGEHLGAWRRRAAEWEAFVARDGNVVRRPAGSTDPAAWVGLCDARGAAAKFAREHLGPGSEVGSRPTTVEGIDPPWVLLEVLRAGATGADASPPKVRVVQADEMEFLDGASCADLRWAASDARVEWFVGADASRRLLAWARARLETRIAGPYIPLAGVRTRAVPFVDGMLRLAEREQHEECERVWRQVEGEYAGRDRAWWAARYREALGGGGEPLRVLIPTTRYSTFIRHASADLCAAFNAVGHRCEVLVEPEEHTHLSGLAYARRFASLRPDLVVLINYARSHLHARGARVIPENVPFVCWVQDAMAHQFDAGTVAAPGELDFLAGHVHEAMLGPGGAARERALVMPVAVSARKFHAGDVDPDLRRRFECEVAYVSHQSETPERMLARLLAEAERAGRGPVAAALADLGPRVLELAADPMRGSLLRLLREESAAALRRRLGAEPGPGVVTLVETQFARPLAERAVRHQTLVWAAELADRRGWRLRIYGRGWDAHERFAPFARAALEHGEELRACYQAAVCHLHASVHTLAHQRVMECALSGGLPLCRMHYDEFVHVRQAAWCAAFGRAEPGLRDGRGWVGVPVADHPELLMLARLGGAIGLPGEAHVFVPPARARAMRRHAGDVPPMPDSVFLLGDWAETTFASPGGLERLVSRAAGDVAWRRAISGSIAGRVRERWTHDVMAARLTAFVARSLAGGAPVPGPAGAIA